MRAFVFLAGVILGSPAWAAGIALQLPLACTLGETCWVQQYPDADPSAGVKDHACGAQSYDGHDGTDIRLRDTSARADVVAAADGVVKAIRDGQTDRLVKTAEDARAIAGRECGNGALIEHGDGWQTQYCHMKQGSVTVKAGDRVTAGTKLGQVGYSGLAAFPHVHLAVRKDDRKVDPFNPSGHASCGGPDPSLWAPEAAAMLKYERGSILRTGFAPGPLTQAALDMGDVEDGPPQATWPAIVAYGWAINLEAGDELVIRIDGPGQLDAEKRDILDRRKAQYLVFAGRKSPQGGRYDATFQVRRHGKVVLQRLWSTTFN